MIILKKAMGGIWYIIWKEYGGTGMTLNQIYYFQIVAKYENYRRAAEELYLSQPSLSRSIAALEEEFGILLFEKTGRGVHLTKAGKLFLEYAERIVRECEIAKTKMQELASDGGKIDIGYVFPLAGRYIPHHVRNFLNKEENRSVTFNFYQNYTREITQKVLSGELDVGFGGYTENEELEFFQIMEEEMILITPKGHELEGQQTVSIQELSKYPVIGYDRESYLGNFTKKLYKRLSMRPNIVVECPDEHSIAALVSEDFGIAMVPRIFEMDEQRINIHKFHDIAMVNRTYMFWVKERYQMPVLERFLSYIMDEVAAED